MYQGLEDAMADLQDAKDRLSTIAAAAKQFPEPDDDAPQSAWMQWERLQDIDVEISRISEVMEKLETIGEQVQEVMEAAEYFQMILECTLPD